MENNENTEKINDGPTAVIKKNPSRRYLCRGGFKKLLKDAFGPAEKDNRKAMRRRDRARRTLIVLALALLAVILIIVLIAANAGGKPDTTGSASPDIPVTEPADSRTEGGEAEEEIGTVAAENGYVPTGNYLDVVTKVKTSDKKVVITVNNLDNAAALNAMLDAAEAASVKLTLFPVGTNVAENPDVQSALRRAYFSLGCEIENHTYSDAALYSLSQEDMAKEIAMGNMAVNKALGMNYEMHFLRTKDGYGENDLRTHQYLEQLGTYKGFALWTEDASADSAKTLKKNLAPGNIYVFSCTESDAAKLAGFVTYLQEQGYDIVTLNSLLGLPENGVTPLEVSDAMSAEIPVPVPFEYKDYVLLGSKNYNRLYAVQLLQQRLKELGYLDMDAAVDGCFGSDTKSAVRYFQYAAGLETDGYAGAETQKILFSDAAPRKQ